MAPLNPALYRVLAGPWRLRPMLGGDDILLGSPDPVPTYPPSFGAFGSYVPSAATTGVPQGTALTRVTGNKTFSTSGQVVSDQEFFGKVSCGGTDVTFQRCIFHGSPTDYEGALFVTTNAAAKRIRVRDCLFDPIGGTKPSGHFGHDVWFERCEFRNLVDAFDPFNTNGKGLASGVIIDQCWIHDFAYYTPDEHANNQTHNDGVQIQGVTNVIVRGNLFQGYFGTYGTPQPPPSNLANPTPAGWANPDLTAALLNTTASLGTSAYHTFEDNFVEGFYLPFNFGGAGAGTDLGHAYRNRFKGDSHVASYAGRTAPWTFLVRSDQVFDAGEGDPLKQNTYYNGVPALIARNG